MNTSNDTEFLACPIKILMVDDLPVVTPSLASLNDYMVRLMRKGPIGDHRPIFVEIKGGKSIVHDGNHRLAVARLLGRKTIPAHVYQAPEKEKA